MDCRECCFAIWDYSGIVDCCNSGECPKPEDQTVEGACVVSFDIPEIEV